MFCKGSLVLACLSWKTDEIFTFALHAEKLRILVLRLSSPLSSLVYNASRPKLNTMYISEHLFT